MSARAAHLVHEVLEVERGEEARDDGHAGGQHAADAVHVPANARKDALLMVEIIMAILNDHFKLSRMSALAVGKAYECG